MRWRNSPSQKISSLGSGKVGTKVRDGGWSSSTWEGVGGAGCGQMTKHDIVDRGVYVFGRVEACAVGAATIWLSSSHKDTLTLIAKQQPWQYKHRQ